MEDSPGAVCTVAANIDLNPVRAGLVQDPKDYRFCGYFRALAGNKALRTGLMSCLKPGKWEGHAEVGYSWKVRWKPRLGIWMNDASGDHDPADGTQQRFDPLFGANFAFYGYSGYFSWQNIIDPAVRFSVQPTERMRAELIFRAFWLASDKDAWVRGLRVDPRGTSGSFVGQELDVRISYPLWRWLDTEIVYAHFFPGEFVANTGPDPGSDFTYLQATLRF